MLLRSDIDLGGDLLGMRLPRRAPVSVTVARGWPVNDGGTKLIQAATARRGPGKSVHAPVSRGLTAGWRDRVPPATKAIKRHVERTRAGHTGGEIRCTKAEDHRVR